MSVSVGAGAHCRYRLLLLGTAGGLISVVQYVGKVGLTVCVIEGRKR